MKVEKKAIILFAEEEKSFLKNLYGTIDTEICDQYGEKCDGCPFSCGASICINRLFFLKLKAISILNNKERKNKND